MASQKQTAANRRNAKLSTGPSTPAGKRTASLNATRHGLTASLRPLPVVEDGDAWTAHHEQTLRSLAPAGYLEELLAERVAVLTWRLGRAVRFESEAAAILQEDVEAEVLAQQDRTRSLHVMSQSAGSLFRMRGQALLGEYERAEDVSGAIRDAGLALELVAALPKLGARKAVDRDAAETILYQAADVVGVDLEGDELPAVPGVLPEPGIEEKTAWTAGEVRDVLELLARMGEVEDLLEYTGLEIESRQSLAERKLLTWERQASKARRERLLPDWKTLENVSRYEGHLHRLLMQTLHELQRLQAARLGGNVAPPAALDVTGNLGG